MHVGPQFSLVVDGPSAGRNVEWAVMGPVSSRAVIGSNVVLDHIWPMGSTGHSQAERHTGLKWAHVYIGPLTGRKSLGCSWAQIFDEQLTGQIWLWAANGPKYWANN